MQVFRQVQAEAALMIGKILDANSTMTETENVNLGERWNFECLLARCLSISRRVKLPSIILTEPCSNAICGCPGPE
jgi:hypothetical protein